MRSVKRKFSSALACTAMLSGLLLATTGAEAGRIGERSYSDSFGNLVIISPSGYKRIVVGQGDLAETSVSGAPDVIYFDEPVYSTSQHRFPEASYRCSGGAAVYRGRSYMYGLSRDEVAVLVNGCR